MLLQEVDGRKVEAQVYSIHRRPFLGLLTFSLTGLMGVRTVLELLVIALISS